MGYLPKNIRQIGGHEERTKVYMEDYVSTYLHRLREHGEEDGAMGFLVGNWQQESDVPCIFIGGAMAVDGASRDAGQVCFSQEDWDQGYGWLGTYFSGQELCGLFVCEGSCRQFRKQALFGAVRTCFPERPAILYLLTEEGEEIVYRILPRGEERLQGYYCYFERNEAMQDYMMDHLPQRRVEWEIARSGRQQEWKERNIQMAAPMPHPGKEGILGDPKDPAYRFRQKMGKKRSASKDGQPTAKGLVALCAVMVLVIGISGIGLIYRERSGVQIQDLLSRLQMETQWLSAVSAMPQETGEHYVGNSGGIMVEEIPGNVYPTEEVLISAEENATLTGEASSSTETAMPSTEEETISTEEESAPAEEVIFNETLASTENVVSPETEAAVSFEDAVSVGTGVLYTVKAGDSLYSISRRFYGTEEMVEVIKQLNNIKNADLIKVGQELLLP